MAQQEAFEKIAAFCTACGKENFPHAKFCGKCGCGLMETGAVVSLHCTKCGTVLPDGVSYCPKCGQAASKVYPTEKLERVSVLPEAVRLKLRNYKEIVQSVTCGECGYVGRMGVVKRHVPWYLTWWVLIPLCCTGIGFIPATVLGAIRGLSEKYEVDCPHCSVRLVTTGSLKGL